MINMIKKDKHITGFQYHNAILDVEGLLYDDMDGVQAFELTSITVTNNINLLEYLGFETVNDIERKAFSLIVQEAERKVCNEIVQQAGNKGLNAIVKEIDCNAFNSIVKEIECRAFNAIVKEIDL